jgi:hypothetical protein
MAVAKAEVPAWTRRAGVLAAFDAVIVLHYALLWVAFAGCLVRVIGCRVFGEDEVPPRSRRRPWSSATPLLSA